MDNIVLTDDTSNRIYTKLKTYEDIHLIKLSFWYTKSLKQVFNNEGYSVVVDNYIMQYEKKDGIFYPFENNDLDLKEFILDNFSQEEFNHTILRYTYKKMASNVFQFDEMEGDEY